MSKRYCLTLDLQSNPASIRQYEEYHRAVWPEILSSIRASGIEQMAIYRFSTRLFMIMDVANDFSFERKAAADAANEKVQEWEQLMWRFQQALPGAAPGEKWKLMDKIFELNEPGI